MNRLSEYQEYVNYFEALWHQNEHIPFNLDGKLDTISKSILVNAIERIVQKVEPNLLLCQGPSLHHDHTIYESVMAAIRPNGLFLPEINHGESDCLTCVSNYK